MTQEHFKTWAYDKENGPSKGEMLETDLFMEPAPTPRVDVKALNREKKQLEKDLRQMRIGRL